MTLAPVTRYTRAPRDGRVIYCPHCKECGTVYHFAWSGLTCQICGKMVEKLDWLTSARSSVLDKRAADVL